ncbi:MAG TPA: tRNA (adenosine(37)-N6)-threonylcarbamoyltransferase complex transferase subunit TsaD [Phycisphaerales bacterium]|nr:tRNA (adenosine(37)-N6)-threonylcarbamoyltransferase complex transferase subunit TsaD [Phycisphaerales bacterium]
MIVLGIETSCDETAASVVRGSVVLSSVIASQLELHAEYAGVVPELASRAHVEALLPVVRGALEKAGVGLGMVDAIAVGNRPGLIGSLLVGVAGAKALSLALGKPLIGVDHVRAHLYSGLLAEDGDPPAGPVALPALGLVVSGGHTAMYHIASWTDVERLGGTIDDAIGEAYDKVASMLGLPHPGGPNLDRLANQHGARDDAFNFPVSRIAPGSLDFSFSGLKTAVLYTVRGVPDERSRRPAPERPLPDETRRDVAASFQRAACRAVVLKLERALERARERGGPYSALLTGGGVTANSRLREDLRALAARDGLDLRLPPIRLCTDNAAMIAGLGEVLLGAGLRSDLSLQAEPTTL